MEIVRESLSGPITTRTTVLKDGKSLMVVQEKKGSDEKLKYQYAVTLTEQEATELRKEINMLWPEPRDWSG